jgi:hypothetical protein
MSVKPPNPQDLHSAHEELTDRVEGLASRVHQLEADGREIRAALAAEGIVDLVANPERRAGKRKLTAAQRQAALDRAAARARAAKPVGKGKGAVSSQTKRKMTEGKKR